MDEYINPIDTTIKDLEEKRRRIKNALESNQFCDNDTSRHNIEVLTKGINAMKLERERYKISKTFNLE